MFKNQTLIPIYIFAASFTLFTTITIHPAAAPKTNAQKLEQDKLALQKREQEENELIDDILNDRVKMTLAQYNMQSHRFLTKIVDAIVTNVKKDFPKNPMGGTMNTIYANNFAWAIPILIEKNLLKLNEPIGYDDSKVTPLTYACKRNKYDIAKALLLAKADPNLVDGDGDTPLNLTITKDCPDAAAILVQFAVNPTRPQHADCFKLAATNNRAWAMPLLVKACRNHLIPKSVPQLNVIDKDLAQFCKNPKITLRKNESPFAPLVEVLALGHGEGDVILDHLAPQERASLKRTCRLFAKYVGQYEKAAYAKFWDSSCTQRFTKLIQPAIDQAQKDTKAEMTDLLQRVLSDGYAARKPAPGAK